MAVADPRDPRHAVIASTLREQIRSGAFAPGSELASEADLSARFSVSRGTVRQALAALRAEGLIAGGRGRRPVVARLTVAQGFSEMVSFSAWAERLGRVPGGRTLEFVRRPADAQSAAVLGLEPGRPVFQHRRLRLLDGEPVMIELSTFVESVGRLLLHCDLEHAAVYPQLAELGVPIGEAQLSIRAVAARPEQATILGVARRAPLLEVRRRVLDRNDTPLESSTDTYRGDGVAVTIHSRVALARARVGLAIVSDKTR